MTTLADVSTGHHAFADWMFLLAMVLALVAAFVSVADSRPRSTTDTTTGGYPVARYAAPLLALAVAAAALGWLVL